jgi:ribosomal protein S6
MRYEILYLIGASKEADLEKIKGEVKELVSSLGGVFEEKETLEKRKMAYKIKQETHGIYVAQRFELPEMENTKEINRKMNLNNNILRFIISRTDDLPELKSKEERIREAEGKAVAPATKPEAKKEAVKPVQKEEAKAEEMPSQPAKEIKKINKLEDIDEKLEEILNI